MAYLTDGARKLYEELGIPEALQRNTKGSTPTDQQHSRRLDVESTLCRRTRLAVGIESPPTE